MSMYIYIHRNFHLVVVKCNDNLTTVSLNSGAKNRINAIIVDIVAESLQYISSNCRLLQYNIETLPHVLLFNAHYWFSFSTIYCVKRQNVLRKDTTNFWIHKFTNLQFRIPIQISMFKTYSLWLAQISSFRKKHVPIYVDFLVVYFPQTNNNEIECDQI